MTNQRTPQALSLALAALITLVLMVGLDRLAAPSTALEQQAMAAQAQPAAAPRL